MNQPTKGALQKKDQQKDFLEDVYAVIFFWFSL